VGPSAGVDTVAKRKKFTGTGWVKEPISVSSGENNVEMDNEFTHTKHPPSVCIIMRVTKCINMYLLGSVDGRDTDQSYLGVR